MTYMNVSGPCSWPYLACPCDALDSLATEGVAELVEMASFQLWAATGRVFGPCPVSVLPCVDQSAVCGACHNNLRQCGCRTVPELRLAGPVAEITEVVIDGAVLDDAAYWVEDYYWLVRVDGGTWPTNVDPIDPDGFRVDYLLGIAPPAGAGLMTGILACELAKAVCNDESCRLPRRAKQITRQGIRVEWSSDDGFGLPEVDSWVQSTLNPILAGAVHSPDLNVVRRITWQTTSP